MTGTSQVTVDGGVISIEPRPMAGAPPGMGRPLVMNPARTAVIIVDMQRYFLETPPFSGMRTILEPTAAFLVTARQAGLAVVHVRTEFNEGMANAGRIGSRTRAMMDSLGTALVQGNPLADVAPELTPGAEDIVITKTRFSGFWQTDLDSVLRKRQIDTLIFAGGTTTVCVESTLRDALFLEYNALVLADCTEDMTPQLHQSALQRINMFFGWVCGSIDVAAALQRVAPAVQVQ
jgi:nicotinamidase-related amidase